MQIDVILKFIRHNKSHLKNPLFHNTSQTNKQKKLPRHIFSLFLSFISKSFEKTYKNFFFLHCHIYLFVSQEFMRVEKTRRRIKFCKNNYENSLIIAKFLKTNLLLGTS